MNRHMLRHCAKLSALLVAATLALTTEARARSPVTEVTSGLLIPLGITQSNQGNLIVAETGTFASHTGRISIVYPRRGIRQTLLDGLPSGINDVSEPSGPAGVFMRGRTLYVAIGIGDGIQAGPSPGTAVGNPNPSSPIFSSILAIHFSAHVEKTTTGFTITTADQQALASGERVTLSHGGGDRIAIELIANFPDFTPNPLPLVPENVRGSNPFDLVAYGAQLYVTDGGQNMVRQVDIRTGAFSVLATFPNIPNPLFNPTPPPASLGGPFVEAVPTGIRLFKGRLLVTLFRGFPFPAGTSVVEQVDPLTGQHAPFITGLKTAIDVLVTRENDHHDRGDDGDRRDDDDRGDHGAYLVLQHASGPVLSGPGLLQRFTMDGPPTLVTNSLNRPTSMTLDKKTGTLYVTEIVDGRVVAIR